MKNIIERAIYLIFQPEIAAKPSQTIEYFALAQAIYNMIESEMRIAETQSDLAEVYPKLVISVEFFRFLRGEFFFNTRPLENSHRQKELYTMENDLVKRLDGLRSKLDLQDSRIKYYLDQGKHLFN